MRKLYKVVATKRIPIIVFSDEGSNIRDETLIKYVNEEEENLLIEDIEIEVNDFDPSAPLGGDFKDWGEGSLVYHEGSEDIPLSEARIIATLSEIIRCVARNENTSLNEAKENLINRLSNKEDF